MVEMFQVLVSLVGWLRPVTPAGAGPNLPGPTDAALVGRPGSRGGTERPGTAPTHTHGRNVLLRLRRGSPGHPR
ncbi:hypothetical protein Pmani_025857 [Petrolisthes manimaculis]|uniref:Secreted protein n=1 Tax=Petrolisthes manimaculis TaxID=1843537 RepID=A0AAE1P5A1_9EUCA|nr:hypothetical protein Pmani_025857 [Petrolisthes manimaculis]